MACLKKEKTGTCSHDQCPFPQETEHGYDCVEFIWIGPRGLCEVGYNCLPKCPHAWFTKETEAALLKKIDETEGKVICDG